MRNRMKVIAALHLSLLVATVVTGCMVPQSGSGLGNTDGDMPAYGVITVQESADVIGALQDDPAFVLLDIRTAAEVEASHLSGAINLDYYSDSFEDDLAALDRSVIYLIYCRTGNRTGHAYRMMAELGFEHVYDMGEGITQWMIADYPICIGSLDVEHTSTDGVAAL